MKFHTYNWLCKILAASLFATLLSCDGGSKNESDSSIIRILSVNPVTDTYTIRNFGTSSKDISGYRLCSEFVYTNNLNGLAVISGSLQLAAGASVTLSGSGVFEVDDTAADFSIYLPTGEFTDAASLVDFVQWGGSGIGRESLAVSKGIWTSGDFITGTPPYSYTGDGAENGLSFWENSDPPAVANIRLLAVNPDLNQVTIKNFGTASLLISTYRFCSEFNYSGDLNSLTIEGSLNLTPGDTVVLTGFALNSVDADLGLYIDNSFGNAASMVDFVQWGAGGNGRESVAAGKGIWVAGTFVSGTPPYRYTGNGSQTGSTNWIATGPVLSANIRLLEVDVNDTITIKNFGEASADISTYRLCSLFDYTGSLSGLTLVSGSLNLMPGDSVTITGFAINDTIADLGLFTASPFSSTANMVDFVQWGGPGNGRESVAVVKGIWATSAFIAGPSPFRYTGDGTTHGLGTWVATGGTNVRESD